VKHKGSLSIDEQGRLVLSPDIAARLHLQSGQPVPFTLDSSGLHLSFPLDHLERIYIEPTNHCNFDCRTCMRNAWEEPLGWMSRETFANILSGIKAFPSMPSIFFGGFGEPLSHPKLIEMIQQVKGLGAQVELITNATLLDETTARELVKTGLDRLWVSIDGASPDSYADVRLGDALEQIIANLKRLRAIQLQSLEETPRLGIAFVAMKRNIHELPEVIRLGQRLGADRFSISNVLPHTPSMREEVLYKQSYFETNQPISQWTPLLQLPRFEFNEVTRDPLAAAMQGRANLSIAGQELYQGSNTCPFIKKRSTSIRWDGEISPCLPLLHAYTSYLSKTERRVKAFSFGNVNQTGLVETWNTQSYRSLRERLMDFDFSPCVFCNSCEMSESNQEDCFGNTTPTCGGCLWAQGFIQCP
jgi:MoaA/NifB/PqqE/SkfB family radical SAM enzyme